MRWSFAGERQHQICIICLAFSTKPVVAPVRLGYNETQNV